MIELSVICSPRHRPALNFSRRSARRSNEEGYILLTLVLFVALLAIAAAVMLPEMKNQMKRDREQELIHRGVQYSRAIQHFVKKVGRYPTTLEELENTNQVRFLRRRYKDPITGKDFKLLHMGEVQMAFSSGIAGATSVANMPGGPGAPGTFNGPGGPGGLAGPGGLNTPGGGILSNVGAGMGPNGPVGIPQQNGSPGQQQAPPGQQQVSAEPGDNEEGTPSQNPATGVTALPGTLDASSGPASGAVQPGVSNNQVFGGGPILGVASTSKEKTIRVFNKKNHYNEWQFVYDPSMDRGGLLTTPNQPQLQNGLSAAPPQGQGQPAPGGLGAAPGGPGGIGSAPTQQPTGPQTPQMPPEE